jgi:hypothetical protein
MSFWLPLHNVLWFLRWTREILISVYFSPRHVLDKHDAVPHCAIDKPYVIIRRFLDSSSSREYHLHGARALVLCKSAWTFGNVSTMSRTFQYRGGRHTNHSLSTFCSNFENANGERHRGGGRRERGRGASPRTSLHIDSHKYISPVV